MPCKITYQDDTVEIETSEELFVALDLIPLDAVARLKSRARIHVSLTIQNKQLGKLKGDRPPLQFFRVWGNRKDRFSRQSSTGETP